MKYFKHLIIILIILSPGALTDLYAQSKGRVTTVNNVDLSKYAGLWYEVAKIPNKFQDHCVKGTTAMYTILEDGRISVVNSCVEKDGEIDKADGIARVVDTKTNSKLEVSFFSILGWRPFWGDYWILGIGEDYSYAVVGTPDRKYGWILARDASPDQKMLDDAFEVLKRNGYDTSRFVMSPQ